MQNFNDVKVGDKVRCISDPRNKKLKVVVAVPQSSNGHKAIVLDEGKNASGLSFGTIPQHWEKVVEPLTYYLIVDKETREIIHSHPFRKYAHRTHSNMFDSSCYEVVELKEVLKD